MPPLLQLRDRNIGFAAAGALPAVRDVSFRVKAGEVRGLVGESGSGKSVSALSILWLLPPQARARGSVEFRGEYMLSFSELELAELRKKFSLAMLFISHDLAVVSQISRRIGVMYAGSMVQLGTAGAVFRRPAHPYTRGLLNSVPTLRTPRSKPLQTIEGIVRPLAAQLCGSSFEPRCTSRIASCATELPPLIEIPPGHLARCPVVAPEVR